MRRSLPARIQACSTANDLGLFAEALDQIVPAARRAR